MQDKPRDRVIGEQGEIQVKDVGFPQDLMPILKQINEWAASRRYYAVKLEFVVRGFSVREAIMARDFRFFYKDPEEAKKTN